MRKTTMKKHSWKKHIAVLSVCMVALLLCASNALRAQSDADSVVVADSVVADSSTLQKPTVRLMVDGGRVWTPVEDTTQRFRLGLSLGFVAHGGLDFTNNITTSQTQIVLLPISAALQAGFRISPHWEIDLRVPINLDGYDRFALLRLYENVIPPNTRSQDIKVSGDAMIATSIMAGLRYSFAPYNRSGFMFSFGGGAMIVSRGGYRISYPANEIVVPAQTEVLPTFYITPQYRWQRGEHWSLTVDFFGFQFVHAKKLQFHSLGHYLTLSYHF